MNRILVRISISSDHCVYPPNQTPDPMNTQISAREKRGREDSINQIRKNGKRREIMNAKVKRPSRTMLRKYMGREDEEML
jgi:hypothetical protein